MKKFIISLSVVFMITILGACGGGDSDGATDIPQPGDCEFIGPLPADVDVEDNCEEKLNF